MDFKQFSKNRQSKKENAEDGVNEDLKKTFDETVKRSKNMSEEQLMNEILRTAAADRQAGRLTDDDLHKFYNTVAPMLDEKQLKKLKGITDMLKK